MEANFRRCFTICGVTKKVCRNRLLALTLLAQSLNARNWSSGCKATRCIFSASESSSARISDAVSRTMQGIGVNGQPLLLHQQRQRLKRRPPAGISNMPVSDPFSIEHGPYVQPLRQAAPRDVFRELFDRDA